MNVSQDSPIVIQSDDDDDDDDIVLVKEENIDKKEEDDVIFISEEPSTSLLKHTPENRKKKNRTTNRLPNCSVSDEDSNSSIPHLKYFHSQYSSISLVDDILRPLDLSQSTVNTRDILPSVINHSMTILKPVHPSYDTAAFPEQRESNSDKTVVEIETNPVKILHDFELSSGKIIDDAVFTGISAKGERFAPLKLPECTDPSSSQTLNTPVCRIDSGKDCFNLCGQGDEGISSETSTDGGISSETSTDSGISSETSTDKTLSTDENQEISAGFCKDNIKWGSAQEKLAAGTYVSSSSLAQDVGISTSFDSKIPGFSSDLLAPFPADSGEIVKVIPSELDKPLVTLDEINTDKSHCSTDNYLTEVNSTPGTSKQLSHPSSPLISQSPAELAKLHVPSGKGSSADNGLSLTLDVNGFSSEDFNRLLDFFSDDGVLVSSANSGTNSKHLNEPGQSSTSDNKVADAPSSVYVNQTDVCISKVSIVSGCISSVKSEFEESHTKTVSHSLDSQNTLSSGLHLASNSNLVGCNEAAKESLLPSVSTSIRNINFKTLHRQHRRTSVYGRKKSSVSHSKNLVLVHPASSAGSSTKPRRLEKHRLAKIKKYSARQSIGEVSGLTRTHSSRTGVSPVPKYSNAKVKKTDPTQWQIVSSIPAGKKCKSRDSDPGDHLPKTKITKLLEDSTEEKPGLKIRLKLSSNTSSVSATPVQSHPSSIGLKKSIIRRHASMTGDTVEEQQQFSKAGTKKEKSDDSEDLLCVTCQKTVPDRKFSKCNKRHGVCSACLETQVKAILTGDIKRKNIGCPASGCVEILSFDELKCALPPFVVDILEEKLDKEYLHYITKWMFTDEQLKSRSEFATSDTRMPPCPALSMRKYEEIYTQESRDPTEDLPTFWTPMERGAPVMVFEVVPDTEEYRALALQFHETLAFGDFDIVRIIRVQNPILWKYFALKRSEMVQENDGMDVIEKQLYHGTHRSTLEAIARKGFDWRLSGKHGTVYGCGSYFAKTSRYSHGYTDRAGSGISVKTGGGPARIIQTHLGMTASLGMGFTTPSANYLSRIRTRVQTLFNLPHSPLMPILPMPPVITSHNQPPQPPPAHYHLPAPPPAHGQMSSLQVPAHNQTSNLASSKNATITGLTTGSCGATGSNLPLVKIISVSSTSSSTPTVPGPSFVRSGYIQPKFATYHNCFSSLKTLNTEPVCNTLDFQSGFQQPSTPTDFQFNSMPSCPTQNATLHTQSSISSNRSSYANAITSLPKRDVIPTSTFPVFAAGNTLGKSINHCQTKSVAVNTINPATKLQTEDKIVTPSSSTKLRAHEKGTADLTKAFSRDTNSQTHFMFVARVLVGRHTGGKAGLKRPPPLDENNPFGKSYDSCVDDIYCPQVFVIFDSNQAYPEYVIEYNWHKD